MEFTYNSLRAAAYEGLKLGNWNGKAVFTCSKKELEDRGNGAYYIIYDDNNSLVSKSGYSWTKYGEVDRAGSVHECKLQAYYLPMKQEYHAVCKKPENECNGTVEVSAAVIGDVKLGIDVDETLRAARTMTIESLLEGFNYGLETKR